MNNHKRKSKHVIALALEILPATSEQIQAYCIQNPRRIGSPGRDAPSTTGIGSIMKRAGFPHKEIRVKSKWGYLVTRFQWLPLTTEEI